MSSANACMSAWMAWDTLVRISARSAGAMCGHGPLSKASRATATALSTSASVASGTRPTTSSVVGLMTSMVPVPEGLTHSPPMNSRS